MADDKKAELAAAERTALASDRAEQAARKAKAAALEAAALKAEREAIIAQIKAHHAKEVEAAVSIQAYRRAARGRAVVEAIREEHTAKERSAVKVGPRAGSRADRLACTPLRLACSAFASANAHRTAYTPTRPFPRPALAPQLQSHWRGLLSLSPQLTTFRNHLIP